MQAGFLYNFFFWTLANFFGAMEISCALLCELEESYHKVVKLLKKKSELEKNTELTQGNGAKTEAVSRKH